MRTRKKSIFGRLREQGLATLAVLSLPSRVPKEIPSEPVMENLPPEKHARHPPEEEPYAQATSETGGIKVYGIREDLANSTVRMVLYIPHPKQGR